MWCLQHGFNEDCVLGSTLVKQGRCLEHAIYHLLSSFCTFIMTGALSIRIAYASTSHICSIMGSSGSGKTTFINEASRSDFTIGRSLESCTSEVQAMKSFKLNGWEVSLIDTPGFDDTSRSDVDILTMIGAYLSQIYEHGTKLAGIIYMHCISDFWIGGTNKQNFKMFLELCGQSTLEVASDLGEMREKELENNFFKESSTRGMQESTHCILQYLIHNQPATLLIQKELVNKHKNIVQTSAGSELTWHHKEVVAQLRKDMETAIQDKDHEMREKLEEEIQTKHEQIPKLRCENKWLEAEFRAAKERLEARINAIEEKLVAVCVELQEELRKEEQQSMQESEASGSGLIEDVVSWVKSWWS
ncbi:hypothetical protein C8R48DRAFT_714278 [Suillus tomentosus]|nr:hypothetical protein C8R48DRAFT_714278 [Suillus tomentosus]